MERKTFCRICAGMCGLVAEIDDQGKLVAIRPDRDNKSTNGFICSKGHDYPEMHHGPGRLRQPLLRRVDGSYARTSSEAALDDLAAKLAAQIEKYGPRSVALYYGTGVIGNPMQLGMALGFMEAIGSPSVFCTMTIDQSAKWVVQGRMGKWSAGRQSFDSADVWLISGANPLVSVACLGVGMSPLDPVKRLKAARERGLKLIVIDPVETATARHADLFLQPVPGEDPALFAAIIRHVIDQGWHDADFCARYVNGLPELRQAIDPFTLAYAERRCGVPADKIRAAAEMFARDGRQGMAAGGTGPDMGPFSNLAEQLIEALNVICGRFPKDGEIVRNTGVLTPARTYHAEVIPPRRSWEQGPRTRVGGYGTLYGTLMTSQLPEEILTPGEGQIRALFCVGANPAGGMPNQLRTVEALQALDLLVTAEPRTTAHTARLATHLFAPRHHLERPGHTLFLEAFAPLGENYAQYSPAVVEPEPDMDVIDDWYLYWALGKRLGLKLKYAGVALDMETPPSSDYLLELMVRHAQVPWEEVKRSAVGQVYARPPQVVQPPREGPHHRFELAPADVLDELQQLANAKAPDAVYSHRLICRREREMMNTCDPSLSGVRRRMQFNPAHINPRDLEQLGLKDGEWVEIRSAAGAIPAILKADPKVRSGAISMNHCWGKLPDEVSDYRVDGSSTCLLVATDRELQSINAMPLMSSIPVRVVSNA